MKNPTAFLLVLSLTSGALSAQESHLVPIPTSGPALHHRLDLDTGRIRDVPPPPGYAATVACFLNDVDVDPTPVSSLDALLFPAGDELYDWGVKTCGGSDFIDTITIGYASMAGAAGGSLTLRMYQSSGPLGFGQSGQELYSVTLTGLPSDAPGTIPLNPRFLTIDLGSQAFTLPDGPIGWSYENGDGQTAPLLVDVQIPLGTQNFFDVYSPGPASDGNYSATLSVLPGGFSNDPNENSFWIRIFQNDTVAAASPISAGANPDVFSALTLPIAGEPLRLEVAAPPGSLVTFAVLTLQPFLGAPESIFGDFYVDLTTQIGKTSISATPQHIYSLPSDAALVGLALHAQGGYSIAAAPGLQLTNGLELFVGTF